jgi:hypothetical protein
MASVPRAVSEHAAEVLRTQAVTVRAGRRAWAQLNNNQISGSWTELVRTLLPAVVAAQRRVAASGATYGAAALAAQDAYVPPRGFVNEAALAGYAADGRSLAGLLYSPATTTKIMIGRGMSPTAANRVGGMALDRILQSTVADTARTAAGIDIAVRPGCGYVRVLVGTSCPNCVILAGRFYRWNAGFKRHPGDDCVHVPTTQALSEGMVTDPYEHFRAMSEAEQDEFWGPADAQAIRDGADIYRVGNARRRAKGMTTLEGTGRDRRGRRAYGRGFAQGLSGGRLTPEGIYAQASSREEALDLLETHGYIIGGQTPGGEIRGRYYEGWGQMGRGGTRRGARGDVEQARRTGIRAPGALPTMTAAERRLFNATAQWEQVLAGRNPLTRDGSGLTPQIAASVERSYRRWLRTGGQVIG